MLVNVANAPSPNVHLQHELLMSGGDRPGGAFRRWRENRCPAIFGDATSPPVDSGHVKRGFPNVATLLQAGDDWRMLQTSGCAPLRGRRNHGE